MVSVNGQTVWVYYNRQGYARIEIKIYRLPVMTKPSCNFENILYEFLFKFYFIYPLGANVYYAVVK